MKITLYESDMKPEAHKNWVEGKEAPELEDFYLSAHIIKSAKTIVFEHRNLSFDDRYPNVILLK